MEKTAKIPRKAINKGDGSIFWVINRTIPFVLIFLFIGLIGAYAEVTVIKSPLTWYEGGQSDYALPKLVNSEYVLPGFAATKGQVKTICVNYNAAGKVAMEVSADNGLHYYPVVNGVPLTDNFISGDRIKWRAKALDAEAKLNTLIINYTDSVGTIASFGYPQLSGFNYRKEILLKNPSGRELFNHQINLKIGVDKNTKGVDVHCDGNLRPDFLDVRFTAADGLTPLPYYLENRIISPSVAGSGSIVSFWVKVPQIPKEEAKIYIYYGNNLAADLSSAKNTFDFYDDFKGDKLDENSWVVKVDPRGSCVLKDGRLRLDAAEVIAKEFKFKQGVIEYSVLVESGLENSLSLRKKIGDAYDNPDLILYSSAYKGAEQCIALDDIVKSNDAKASPITAAGRYNYRLIVNDKDITFQRLDPVSADVQTVAIYSGSSAAEAGYPGLRSGGDGNGRNIIAYSEIRARKFANPQPQVDKCGQGEPVKLPVFSNITLSPKGSLMLGDNIKEGIYISKKIPAAFTARIIVPTFKGTNAAVDVSADNGVNYKRNCSSGNYYYASLKDFTAGEDAVEQVKLKPVNTKKEISQLEEIGLNYSPGVILVVKPNGAETWLAGTTEDISWSALDYENSYPLKLEYSPDNGKNYSVIADRVSNSGSYSWLVPQDAQTKTALIRVSDSNEISVNDVSDRVFTILK